MLLKLGCTELSQLVAEAMKEFGGRVITDLQRAYPTDPVKQVERLKEIVGDAFQHLIWHNSPEDLPHYFRVATLGEGEDRPVTYDEVCFMLKAQPVTDGQLLYHFSNRQHPTGFGGHEHMCFTSVPDLDSVIVAADGLDDSLPVYMHTARVTNPLLIKHHDAFAYAHLGREAPIAVIRKEIIENKIFNTHNPGPPWYILTMPSGIEVTEVERVK